MNSDSDTEFLIEKESSDEEFSFSESESDDDSLESARDWCRVDITISHPSHPKFPFTGNPGLKVSVGDSEDPLDYFNLFFDDDIFNFIVSETNRYAESHFQNAELTPSSRALKWKNINNQEMKRFIALLLLQGIVQKPMEKWFWSKRPILSTPFFGNIMSEIKYGLIMKFLHFENSDAFDENLHLNPKFRKVSELHSMLVQRFKSVYVPKQDISVDESLIAYKGRLGWKQYIPNKRARFGLKLFQLCESESGYIWNSCIYTGKGTVFHNDYNHLGVSTKSVMTLLHDLKGKGYCLTTDNYYTSPELAELLINSKTDICGTLRPNRKGLPALLKSSSVKKGEIIAFQKGKMCVMKWKDKKPLHMLSTFHNADMMEVKSKKENSAVKVKPKAVVLYNATMSGVDRSDQYYPVARNQQRKYYKKIFRHLLNQAVWNSFVIYKKNGGRLNHIGFRMKLVERLIEVGGTDPSTHRYVTPKESENVVRLIGRHFPSYVESECSKKRKSVRKCVVCCLATNENGKRIRRETRFECKDCNVGLCAAPCFEKYHTVTVL
ncbi:PiggyBac transposable element-derived protein 4 [Araneus ventricosus]|uniref:PiggyBac transposable element-derived protein 4 n=1 Tax=Araneus ventricosus TaxID=182803 RepID=A0A4Y2TTF1_ARAVE|nr:PiggyBac transposable element-derived protein 4 [Araneus ventricosus]